MDLPHTSLPPHHPNTIRQMPLDAYLMSLPTHPPLLAHPLPQPPSPHRPPPRHAKRRRARPSAPTSIVAPPIRGSDLPGEFSTVDHISSVRQQPLAERPPVKQGRKRHRHRVLLRQYLVHWAPEVIPYLEVEKQRRAGFRSSSLEVLLQVHDPELDDDDVRAPCHQCGFGAGHQSTGPPLFQCERCSRWWHAHCLPGSPLPALIEAVPVWTCPSCRPATPHCPAPLQLCRVQWVPEWQGEKHIRSLKGGPDALNRFLARPPPHQQLPELHASPPTHQHHPELHATLRPNTPPARKVAGSRRRAPTRPPRSPPPPEPTPLSAITNIVLDVADPDRDAAPTGYLSLITAPPASSLNPGPTPLYSLHYP